MIKTKTFAKNNWQDWLINFILMRLLKTNATEDYNGPTRANNVFRRGKKTRRLKIKKNQNRETT